VDAVAALMNCTEQSWARAGVAGTLPSPNGCRCLSMPPSTMSARHSCEVSQGAGGGGAGRSRGRVARLRGIVWGTNDAPTEIPRDHQAGNLGKKVCRCPSLGGGPDYRTEVQDTGKQRSNRTVAGVSKRLAVRFHQLKTGHCLCGQYL